MPLRRRDQSVKLRRGKKLSGSDAVGEIDAAS